MHYAARSQALVPAAFSHCIFSIPLPRRPTSPDLLHRRFNVWVAQILISEQLQIPVEVVQYVGDDHQYYEHAADGRIALPSRAYNWDALVRASVDTNCSSYPLNPTTPEEECSHAMLELWSGQDANKAKYTGGVNGGFGAVKHAGALGALGRIGWYANDEILSTSPQVASFHGLRSANLTSTAFRRPLRFSEACALNASSLSGLQPALCAAFASEFLDAATGAVLATWQAELGGAYASFYVKTLTPSAESALADRLGGSLPSPVFGGAFVPDVDEESGAPIGTLLSVPCSWTEHDEQITGLNGLALRPRRCTRTSAPTLKGFNPRASHTLSAPRSSVDGALFLPPLPATFLQHRSHRSPLPALAAPTARRSLRSRR